MEEDVENSIPKSTDQQTGTISYKFKLPEKSEIPDELHDLSEPVRELKSKLAACKTTLFAYAGDNAEQIEEIWEKKEADFSKKKQQKKAAKNQSIKLNPHKESAHIRVTKVQHIVKHAINDGVNDNDNLGPSTLKNLERVGLKSGGGLPLNTVEIVVPVGILHAGIHFGVGTWYTWYKREAWDAYFFKEGKVLDEICTSLETNLFLTRANIDRIIDKLVEYEDDTREFEKAIVIAVDTQKQDKLRLQVEGEETQSRSLGTSTSESISEEKKPEDESGGSDAEAESIPFLPPEKVSGLPAEAKPESTSELKSQLTHPVSSEQDETSWFIDVVKGIPGSSGFNMLFAYAWNYWFVFYYALWGILGISAAVLLTPALTLLALAAPIIYLLYKEYIAYNIWSVANETVLDEKERQQLNQELEGKNRADELKRMLREKADEATEFRYGWLVIALIAGVTMVTLCGLPILPAIFAGLTVSVGILFVYKGIAALLTRKATDRREELLNTSDKLGGVIIQEKSSQDWKNERIAMLKNVDHLAGRLSPKQRAQLQQISYAAERIAVVQGLSLDNEDDKAKVKKIKRQLALQMLQAEKTIQAGINARKATTESQDLESNHNEARAGIRKWMNIILNFLSGYMLVCLIGFGLVSWLDAVFVPIIVALGGAPIVLLETFFCNFIIGVIGLVVAGSFGYATWKSEAEDNAKLKQMHADPAYLVKQQKLQFFKEQAAILRDRLREDVARVQNEQHKKHLVRWIEKPPKEPTSTLRWLAKRYLWGVDGALHVASALLIVRAVLTMGFFATATATTTLLVFGAAAVTNPFGIAVLTLTVVVLLARWIRQFYLERQKVKELKQFRVIDEKLEKHQSEYERLLYAQALLDKEQTFKLNQPNDLKKEEIEVAEDTEVEDADNLLSVPEREPVAQTRQILFFKAADKLTPEENEEVKEIKALYSPVLAMAE